MHLELHEKIDQAVNKFKKDLYARFSTYKYVRNSSDLFDFEQALQTDLNHVQVEIIKILFEIIHQDEDFVEECIGQAIQQFDASLSGSRLASIRTLSGQEFTINTPYVLSSNKWYENHKNYKLNHVRKIGTGLFPVLRKLGVIKGTTPKLLAEVNYQIAESSSGKNAEYRLASYGININDKRMWRYVNNFTSVALWQRQLAIDNLSKTGDFTATSQLAGKRVVVGIDGGRQRIRINKREDENTYSKEYTTGKYEPKIFVIYTINRDGKKDDKDKLIYDGTIQQSQDLFELLHLRLKQLGIEKAESLIMIGDGARWIWKGVAQLKEKLNLENCSVVEVVDFAHSVGKLNQPSKIGIKGYLKQQKWFKLMRKLLKKGEIDEVIMSLKLLDASKDSARDIEKAINYFEFHKLRLQYAQFRADGLPIGSGVIESGVRRIINMRMSGASIFWKPETAESILYLRCQIKGNVWIQFFKQTLLDWASNMHQSLPQAHTIKNDISEKFLETHPPICLSARNEVIRWAFNLFDDDDALIIDTETTGLSDQDEIIQLAIINLDGEELINTQGKRI